MITAAVKITAGFILDLLLGDPQRFPHPVRLIGSMIIFLEKHLRRRYFQRFAGVIRLQVFFSLSIHSQVLSLNFHGHLKYL
jgi:adenosylcobinamide-phosphate synthase